MQVGALRERLYLRLICYVGSRWISGPRMRFEHSTQTILPPFTTVPMFWQTFQLKQGEGSSG